MILYIVKKVEIYCKVRTITSDSGAEMPPAVKIVQKKVMDEFTLHADEDFHIRCISHVNIRAVMDAKKII